MRVVFKSRLMFIDFSCLLEVKESRVQVESPWHQMEAVSFLLGSQVNFLKCL